MRVVGDEEGRLPSELAPAVLLKHRPKSCQVLRECLVAAEIGKFVPDDRLQRLLRLVHHSMGVRNLFSRCGSVPFSSVPVLRAHKEGIARHCGGPTSTLLNETIFCGSVPRERSSFFVEYGCLRAGTARARDRFFAFGVRVQAIKDPPPPRREATRKRTHVRIFGLRMLLSAQSF